MIRIERDPAFWAAIAEHPELTHIAQGQELDWAAMVGGDDVTPYAAEHGGFLVKRLDFLGRAMELHVLFTPEGWGKEVYHAAVEMFETVFSSADLMLIYETSHPQSRPPLSFGWKPAAEFKQTEWGDMRTWLLTEKAWRESPAGRRSKCRQSS